MGTLRLPVSLTDADRLAILAEMSEAQTALEAVKAEKKREMAEYNEQIKGHEQTIHERNGVIRAGVIVRDVEVETREEPFSGKTETWRLDNNTLVRAVDLDPDERQVKLGLPNPGATDIAPTDHADEQTAASPEEAEALRAERLVGERAERISAAVVEARGRITVIDRESGDDPDRYAATLQHGNTVLEASAATEDAAREGVVTQVTEILEIQEDAADVWSDAVAASKAEQDRQEVERLAAEQAKDEAATPKRGFKKGLQAPKGAKRKRHLTTLPDGREVDPEVEAAALDGEPPTPGDDGPVATGDIPTDPESGLAF